MLSHAIDARGLQVQRDGAEIITTDTCTQLARDMDRWRVVIQIKQITQNRGVMSPSSDVSETQDVNTEMKFPANYNEFCNYAVQITYRERKQWLKKTFGVYKTGFLEINYLLTCNEGFALWTDEQGMRFGGYKAWQEKKVSPANETRIKTILADPIAAAKRGLKRREKKQSLVQTSPVEILQALFDEAEGPITYDDLELIFEPYINLLQATPSEGTEVRGFGTSQDDESSEVLDPNDPQADVQRDVSNRDFVRILLKLARDLSYEQKTALLLNLKDGDIRQIVCMGIATIDEIALLLEMTEEQLKSIWYKLPLNDEAIASRLGATVLQVKSLRAAAMRTLQERLRPFAGSDLRDLWLAAIALSAPKPAVLMLHLRDRHGFSILRMLQRVSTPKVPLGKEEIAEGLSIAQWILDAVWEQLPLDFENISKIALKHRSEVIVLYKDAYIKLRKHMLKLQIDD